jgi:CheY-like chemotaxis protein
MNLNLFPSAAGNLRWMVVDDSAEVLELAAMLLERLGGARVSRCRSGAAALAEFAAAPGTFGFVLTDLVMPGMDGIELCRRLRAQAPGLPVLLATGSALITRAEARNLGFCGLLEKPFLPGTLRAALKTAGIATQNPDGNRSAAPLHFDPVAAPAAA